MDAKEQTTRKMRDHIRWICERIGPRPPCSEAERKCAEYIRSEWAKHADRAWLEEFFCHPGAYAAAFRWPVALFLVALCLYPVAPVASFAGSALSTLILLSNLILNRELIDRAFPRKQSSNVIAKFEPTGPTERLVILSCHHDSNFAFPIVNRFGSGFGIFMAIVVLANASLALLTFLRVLFSVTGPASLAAGYEKAALHILVFLAATVPVQLYVFFRALSDKPVLGANDNLSGVANCLLLAEHLSCSRARPRRTAVWLVSFGCEECGIRGSKRFIRRHREDIRNAHVLNLDMVGGKGTRLQVVTREERNLIRLSRVMVRHVEEAAGEAGIPLRKGPIIAFTDAMAFAVKGIRATTLMALDENGLVDTYHSVEDRPEHLDDEVLFDTYRLCVAFLKHIDGGSGSD
jgi:hypothetical protein